MLTFTVLFCAVVWLVFLVAGETSRRQAPHRPPLAPSKAPSPPPMRHGAPSPLGALLLGFLILAVVARATTPSEDRGPCPK